MFVVLTFALRISGVGATEKLSLGEPCTLCAKGTFVRIAHSMAEVIPLRDAVADLVHDGDSVALEGFTHLIRSPPATSCCAKVGGSSS
jgi:hypothetical protein